MSKFVFALMLAMLAVHGQAGPVRPVVPCDRAVFMFGDATVLGQGARMPAVNGLATRLEVFFRRVCGGKHSFETFARTDGRLVDELVAIGETLTRRPRSIAFVHFPYSDIESGVRVDALLRAYRDLTDMCARTGAICIVGGQQPVNSLTSDAAERQLELERRASSSLGSSYVALYRYFESEAAARRLMTPLDSGDGRFVNDEGHATLFELFRRRVLELPGANR